MIYAEASFAGPDIYGRTFPAEPVHHCSLWAEHNRLQRKRRDANAAIERERRSRPRYAGAPRLRLV